MNIPDEVADLAAAAWAATFTNSRKISQHAEYEVVAEWARKEALREAEEAIRENAGIENEHGICGGVASWPQDRGSAYSTGTSEAIEVVRDLLAGH